MTKGGAFLCIKKFHTLPGNRDLGGNTKILPANFYRILPLFRRINTK